jgi:hypothetical protein
VSDLTAAEYIHLRHISLTGKKAADELDRLRRESEARKAALAFAQSAIDDAILSEDGLDGDAGARVLHIIEEAVTLGTFDQVKYGDLPKGMWELECDRLRRELADRHGECCCVTHGEVAHMLHCAVCVDGLRRELADERERHEQLQARCFDGGGSQNVFDALAEARELLQEQVIAAYIAGAKAVHDNWLEDRCPDFTEAAHDHWAIIDAALAEPKEAPRG